MAFEDLKRYLGSPQLLTNRNIGDTLFLYLEVTRFTAKMVMVKEERGEHRQIYYVNKVLQWAKTKYSTIDKFAYTIVIVAKKIKPYF